jgi:F-type H+-transporting ATPase subunit epsilon
MSLNVNVVDANNLIWKGECEFVVAPSADGEIGIYSGHVPVLSILKKGTVTIRENENKQFDIKISKGFISVDSDNIEITVESAEIIK